MTKLPGKLEKILKTIEDKGYRLLSQPESVIGDVTRKNFVATLEKDGEKFFLKTRMSKRPEFKVRIRREILFYTFLKEKKLALYKFTPGFIEGQIGDVDYYITWFTQGKNLGSRTQLDRISLTLNQLPYIFKIIDGMTEIDTSRLLKLRKKYNRHHIDYKDYFEVRDSRFYRAYFSKQIEKLKSYIDARLVEKVLEYVFIPSFERWLDESAKTLSHGDFQAVNLLDTGQAIKVVDWDNVGVDNPLFDIVYFWVHSWRRPRLRSYFIRQQLAEKDKEHFLRLATYLLAIQLPALRRFLSEPPDFAESKELALRKKAYNFYFETLKNILRGKNIQ